VKTARDVPIFSYQEFKSIFQPFLDDISQFLYFIKITLKDDIDLCKSLMLLITI